MRPFLLLFAFFLLSTTIGVAQEGTFIKSTHTVELDASLKATVFFKDKFLCLKADGEMIAISPTSHKLEGTFQTNTKDVALHDIFLRNDSLIGVNEKNTYFLTNENVWKFLKQGRSVPIFYQDKEFTVSISCSGEWGGSVYFTHNKTKKRYEAKATCPLTLLKQGNTYIVTASLAHMIGFTEVISITAPSQLKPYNRNHLKKKKVIHVGEDESTSTQGATTLIDTVRVIAITSFPLDENIYYVLNTNKAVIISSIKNGTFKTEDVLRDKRLASYGPVTMINGEKRITTFTYGSQAGFLVIEQNKLDLYLLSPDSRKP